MTWRQFLTRLGGLSSESRTAQALRDSSAEVVVEGAAAEKLFLAWAGGAR